MNIYNQEESSQKRNRFAEVYWIHLKEHTNIFKEGYIGVSINFESRIFGHFSKLRNNNHENQHLQNAFNLYKEENLITDILLNGLENYCYEIEEKLRPKRQTGWNINKGGYKPPDPTGRIVTEATRQKLSEIVSRRPMTEKKLNQLKKASLKASSMGCSEELRRKRSQNRLGKKNSEEQTLKSCGHYLITFPDGHQEEIVNMAKFCREYNLYAGNMNKVANGKNNSIQKI